VFLFHFYTDNVGKESMDESPFGLDEFISLESSWFSRPGFPVMSVGKVREKVIVVEFLLWMSVVKFPVRVDCTGIPTMTTY